MGGRSYRSDHVPHGPAVARTPARMAGHRFLRPFVAAANIRSVSSELGRSGEPPRGGGRRRGQVPERGRITTGETGVVVATVVALAHLVALVKEETCSDVDSGYCWPCWPWCSQRVEAMTTPPIPQAAPQAPAPTGPAAAARARRRRRRGTTSTRSGGPRPTSRPSRRCSRRPGPSTSRPTPGRRRSSSSPTSSNLIADGADALIILAQDGTAILPAVQSALEQGIPVIAYDRLIEDPGAFYLTFDNVEVGRMQARAILEAVPEGNYVFIKGNQADANADFLFGGQMEVLQESIDSGAIVNVGESYTDNWDPAIAQTNMEQFLTDNNNDVQAVVASNDGMAGGVVAALEAQGLAGQVPGLRPGRRRRRPQPGRPRHPDGVGVEERLRPRSDRRRDRRAARRGDGAGRRDRSGRPRRLGPGRRDRRRGCSPLLAESRCTRSSSPRCRSPRRTSTSRSTPAGSPSRRSARESTAGSVTVCE